MSRTNKQACFPQLCEGSSNIYHMQPTNFVDSGHFATTLRRKLYPKLQRGTVVLGEMDSFHREITLQSPPFTDFDEEKEQKSGYWSTYGELVN